MTKPEEFERCAWCGELAEDGLEIEGLRACLPCAADEIFRGSDNRWSTKQTPVPQEQRFEALFDAARVLLNERIGDEDVVIPTLAFANGIDEGYMDLADARRRLVEAHQAPELQEAETKRFVRSCPRFRPVSIVDGVVILERLPVSVEVNRYAAPHIDMPKSVTLEVTPSFRMVGPEQVAALYQRVLATADISCTEGLHGYMSWRFDQFPGYRLVISVEHRHGSTIRPEHLEVAYPDGRPVFSHPSTIREYYKMLMGSPEGPGFAQFLVGRSRGHAPLADTLVPACVAAYLRHSSGIPGRKEIHALLNEHVFRGHGKALPQEGYSSSAVNQLWRDVEKVQRWTRYADFQLFA